MLVIGRCIVGAVYRDLNGVATACSDDPFVESASNSCFRLFESGGINTLMILLNGEHAIELITSWQSINSY